MDGNYRARTGFASRAFVRQIAGFQDAFIEQFFHQVVKQPALAYDSDTMRRLRQSFVASDFNLQKLLVEIAVTGAAHGTETPVKTTKKK